MRTSFQIARLAGAAVRVHGSVPVVLAAALLSHPAASWPRAAAVLLGLALSIALHEMGHTVAALRRGCRPLSILLLPVGGLARLDRIPPRPRDEMAVALAGPVSSLGLGTGLLLAQLVLKRTGADGTAALAGTLGGFNLVLGFFNLAPVFPLDGARLFRALLAPWLGRGEAARRTAGAGRLLPLAFGGWSLVTGHWLNLALAAFAYLAASAEYRAVQADPAERRGGGVSHAGTGSAGRIDPEEIVVGPPPYAKREPPPAGPFHGEWRSRGWALFDEILDFAGRG